MVVQTLSRTDKVFNVFNIGFMCFIVIIMAYPLYFIIIASISDPMYANAGKVILFPRGIMWDGYQSIFNDSKI